MNILWTLIIGLVVGAIAKFLMPGRDPGGIFITMLLGVAGAFLAGFLGRSLGWYSTAGSGPGSIASLSSIASLPLLFTRLDHQTTHRDRREDSRTPRRRHRARPRARRAGVAGP